MTHIERKHGHVQPRSPLSEQKIARRTMYMTEIEEMGLNNFNADVAGGYRRVAL